jgi:hypothetical protein
MYTNLTWLRFGNTLPAKCHGLAMNMQPMSLSQLILNNPEWMGVFANALFAVITIGVIAWQGFMMRAQVRVMAVQVRVMQWQGHLSARHERIQNRLIRLQHEHEWLLRLNAERDQVLKLGRSVHLAAACVQERLSGDKLHWEELQDRVRELSLRLRILDVRSFLGPHDTWYQVLSAYANAVQEAVVDDLDSQGMPSEVPNDTTRKTLYSLDAQYQPVQIFLALEEAIRMEFSDFKDKWDAALPT